MLGAGRCRRARLAALILGRCLPHRWCLRDERPVSTVVFGASSAEQVAANVAAVSLSRQLDEATLHAIDALSATAPRPHPSFGHTALQKLNAAPKE